MSRSDPLPGEQEPAGERGPAGEQEPAGGKGPAGAKPGVGAEPLAIEAQGLVKSYKDFVAVRGIDFTVARGAFFGFLGPNGAGKTSTMRLIQAVARPTAGHLRVLGLDPVARGKEVRARIGVCPQDNNLDPDLTVRDNLLMYGSYYPQSSEITARRTDELIEFFQLSEKRNKGIGELSGGMKRRLTVARSLINDPELVVLDEPTTGLDPQARHVIWQKLRELRDRGITLVLTTHYMDEAERLCDEVVIMDGGKILALGAPKDLIKEHVGDEVVELRLAGGDARPLLQGIDLSGLVEERAGDLHAFFTSRRDPRTERIVERARNGEVPCLVRNSTLEDVFLRLTGRELSER